MIDDNYNLISDLILTPTIYLELKKSFFNSSNFKPSTIQDMVNGNMGTYYNDADMTKRFVFVEYNQ